MSINKIIKDQVIKILFNSFKVYKVKKNKVVFMNTHSSLWNGNLKAIYDQMQIEKPNYNCVKILKKNHNSNSLKYGKVVFDKLYTFYHLCTSEYIIINDYVDLFAKVKLRKGTQLIQVWHAGGAFKKFGIDSLHNIKDREAMKNVLKMHSQYSKVIVSGKELIPIYAQAFGIQQERVKALGLPRADIFFDKNSIRKIKKECISKYITLKDKKVILYAPTFRDNDRQHYNLELDLEYLCNNISEDYMVILKMHPFIKNKISIPKTCSRQVLDLSNEDISDLMIVADVLITDYSSVIFEFSIMEKPMIFYAYDLEYYEQELRGFYYDYKDFVPGPIARTTEQVAEFIEKDEWNLSSIRVFKERFNIFADGKATERLIDELFE